MGAGASVPGEFSALATEKQHELKVKFAADVTEKKKTNPFGDFDKEVFLKVKTEYFEEEITKLHPIIIPLTELTFAINTAITKGKTPLIIDNSPEDKVNTFFSYQSASMVDGKKMGLDKSLRKIPVQDIMEGARQKLVAALKFGQPLVIAMTKSVTDFAQTFTDEVAAANGSLNTDAGKYFPLELFRNAGKDCTSEANLNAIFRQADKEHGLAFSRNPDGFHVILTSQFAPEDYDEYLFGNDYGLPKPKEMYQVFIVDDSKPPFRIQSDEPEVKLVADPVLKIKFNSVPTSVPTSGDNAGEGAGGVGGDQQPSDEAPDHDIDHEHHDAAVAEYKALVANVLCKNDLKELSSLAHPPNPVKPVGEAICIMLKVKPDWANFKKVASNFNQFSNAMMNYDLDHIPPKVMKQLIAYCSREGFNPNAVGTASKAAAALCRIVCALVEFDKKARGH